MSAEEAALARAAKQKQDAEDADDAAEPGQRRAPGEKASLEEREDASRAFEEELDDMAVLEERVRRLKDKREALRTASGPVAVGGGYLCHSRPGPNKLLRPMALLSLRNVTRRFGGIVALDGVSLDVP